jgi:hypothetical protein
LGGIEGGKPHDRDVGAGLVETELPVARIPVVDEHPAGHPTGAMTLWMDRAAGENASGSGSIGTMTSFPLAQDRFEDRLVSRGAGRVNEDVFVLGDRAQPGQRHRVVVAPPEVEGQPVADRC